MMKVTKMLLMILMNDADKSDNDADDNGDVEW